MRRCSLKRDAAFVPDPVVIAEVSTVAAVKKVANGATAGSVNFLLSLDFVGSQVKLGGEFQRLVGRAFRTAIGKAGLVWPQLKLLRADDTCFDLKSHCRK
jgi:hypothetical protein